MSLSNIPASASTGALRYARGAGEMELDFQFLPDGTRFTTFAMHATFPGPTWRERDTAPDLLLALPGRPAQRFEMMRIAPGCYAVSVPWMREALLGARYGFVLDDSGEVRAPGALSLPEGPGKLAQVIDPSAYAWQSDFKGVAPGHEIILEAHVSRMTSEGTLRAAMREIPRLAQIGINTLELMPIHGPFGWGYDMVTHANVDPALGDWADLQAFVDCCHAHRIQVILDLVDNHIGNDRNVNYAAYPWFRGDTTWGTGINFDGPHNEGANVLYEQRAERFMRYARVGVRADAVQNVVDLRTPHHLARVTAMARQLEAETGRRTLMVAESDLESAHVVSRGAQGWGFDKMWGDYFHHALFAWMLAWNHKAHYVEAANQLVSVLQTGSLAGKSMQRVRPAQLVFWLEDHDHLGGNDAREGRITERFPLAAQPALALLTLLAGPTPMLFFGQERGATQPFPFFRRDIDPETFAWTRAEKLLDAAQAAGVGLPAPHDGARFKRALKEDPALFSRVEQTLRESGHAFYDPESDAAYDVALAKERTDGRSPAFEAMYTQLIAFRQQHAQALAEHWPHAALAGTVLRVTRPQFAFAINLSPTPSGGFGPWEVRLEHGFPSDFRLPTFS